MDRSIHGFQRTDEAWLEERLQALGLRATALPGAPGTSAQASPLSAHRALVDRLLGLVAGDGRDEAAAIGVEGTRRRLATVMAARSLAAHPHNHAVSVEALCEQLHLTPRTLHNHFASVVGESPAEFLRVVRLNACRRRLRGAPHGHRVQDVAAQWGFFHMGRFSHEWRRGNNCLSTIPESVFPMSIAHRVAALAAATAVSLSILPSAWAQGAPVTTPSGLVYQSLKEGSGASPAASDTVKVHYRGTLLDGKEFDSSYKRGEPIEFPLSGVIPCWTEGVQKMKPGGKAKLTCPPAIAYGARGAGGVIPPNATLNFEVELISVRGR